MSEAKLIITVSGIDFDTCKIGENETCTAFISRKSDRKESKVFIDKMDYDKVVNALKESSCKTEVLLGVRCKRIGPACKRCEALQELGEG